MTLYYKCSNCDTIYDLQETSSEPISCPTCGSLQDLSVSVEETIQVHEWIKKKDKLPGVKRPSGEQVIGDEIAFDTGKWVYKQQIIDRTNNWYYEIVIDKETGNIIHLCSEPLDQHLGYGSDKERK
jgi:PHP family Zn ribbon phosphoesterase